MEADETWINYGKSTIEDLKRDVSFIMEHFYIKRQGPCRICEKKWHVLCVDPELRLDKMGECEESCYYCESNNVSSGTHVICKSKDCRLYCSGCGKIFCRDHAACMTKDCRNCIMCSATCDKHGRLCLDLFKCEWTSNYYGKCRMCPFCYPSSLVPPPDPNKPPRFSRELCSFHLLEEKNQINK